MARPPKTDKEKRKQALRVYVNEAEKRAIEERAALGGFKSASAFVRRLLGFQD